MKTLITLLAGALILPSVAAAQLGATVDVSGTVGSTIEFEEAHGEAEATIGTEATLDTDASSDAFGDFMSNSAGVYVTTAEQVATEDDLDVLGNNLMTAHEGLVYINASKQEQIAARYDHHGRILWIFPATVRAETVVRAGENGTIFVDTKTPWWSFLVMGTGNISGSVDQALATNATLTADMQASADVAARARILESIVSAHASLASSAQVN